MYSPCIHLPPFLAQGVSRRNHGVGHFTAVVLRVEDITSSLMSWEGFALAYADINQANNSLSYKGKVYYSQKAGNHPVFKAFHSYRYVRGGGLLGVTTHKSEGYQQCRHYNLLLQDIYTLSVHPPTALPGARCVQSCSRWTIILPFHYVSGL